MSNGLELSATLEDMTPPPVRAAVRVVALDDANRVLLLRYVENGGFWATPGGALEDGEDDKTAIRRELGEELGVDANTVELGAPIARRSADHPVGGQRVQQVERYYLARLAAADIDPDRATQPDGIRGHRWWTMAELRATRQTVYPVGLDALIADVVSDSVPERPVVLR